MSPSDAHVPLLTRRRAERLYRTAPRELGDDEGAATAEYAIATMAAVAFALRHGPTVVPLLRPGSRDDPRDSGEVWTYRDPATGEVALLLFSDATHKPATLPPHVGLHSPLWLRDFLATHGEVITTVFFDIAGPHPLQAAPADLLAALDA